jgi:hypothetical protein
VTFRPDPAAQSGTYETSDTSGPTANFGHVEDTTAAFDIARANDLAWALRAMDAADTAVPFNLVQTSPGLTVNRGDPAADRERIIAAAARNRHHLERLGWTFDEHGTPVAAPRDYGDSFRNGAPSFGPMTDVPATPTGAAG